LTEGAIGYRKFDVLQGFKLLADITLADGSVPPFGASVTNARSGEMSVIDEGGLVYLVGVKPAEAFDIAWGGLKQCRFYAPDSVVDLSRIQLTCNRLQKVVN
jgi:outer membrane usher protein PapC